MTHTQIFNLYCIYFSVREFIEFTSKIVAERTNACSRASVKEQGIFFSAPITPNLTVELGSNYTYLTAIYYEIMVMFGTK